MPKRYKVEVSTRAEQDVHEIHDVIAADKPVAAAQWVRAFGKHGRSLRQLPYRYEEAAEAELLGLPLHQIIFGNYRIFYVVGEKRVQILRVIHAARTLRPEMFAERR
jgi:plasmid stabilization system protein ParE